MINICQEGPRIKINLNFRAEKGHAAIAIEDPGGIGSIENQVDSVSTGFRSCEGSLERSGQKIAILF